MLITRLEKKINRKIIRHKILISFSFDFLYVWFFNLSHTPFRTILDNNYLTCDWKSVLISCVCVFVVFIILIISIRPANWQNMFINHALVALVLPLPDPSVPEQHEKCCILCKDPPMWKTNFVHGLRCRTLHHYKPKADCLELNRKHWDGTQLMKILFFITF